jgi:hypothetical protein
MEKIAEFLKIGKIDGDSTGDDYRYGDGSGNEDGYGYGYGTGDGSGGNDPYNEGYGSGSGYGADDRYGEGVGYGKGWSYGYGTGDGNGSSDGWGYGLKSINNHQIYKIDGVNTIIYSIRNNIAKGAILNDDLTLSDCYIVKAENEFAHGKNLKEAQISLLEKLLISKPIDIRLEEFKNSFPEIDGKYNAKDLYDWHYLLTGSCKMGRDSFVKDNSIDLSKKYSVREFIDYTKESYQGDIIKQLEKMY